MTPLDQAIEAYLGKRRKTRQNGGKKIMAKLLRVHPATVGRWSVIPAEHVLKVEKHTGISRHVLRPDIYGPRKPEVKG